jgi:hypothetical protein
MVGLCAICIDEGPGTRQTIDGKLVFVCDRCENEHPRAGHITFDDSYTTGKVSSGTAAQNGWGGSGMGHRPLGRKR